MESLQYLGLFDGQLSFMGGDHPVHGASPRHGHIEAYIFLV